MKLLIVGDFHGKLSKSLERKIRKISPDLILSSGDFCGSKKLEKFIFERILWSDKELSELEELIYLALRRISFEAGIDLIRKLKKLNIPVLAIRGNWDPSPFGSDLVGKLSKLEIKESEIFEKVQTKKFRFVDMIVEELGKFILVGGASSSSPQRVKKNMIKRLMKEDKMSLKEAKDYVSILQKNWDSRQRLYDKNFREALRIKKKTNKKVIFLTHNCPYKSGLDKIKTKSGKKRYVGSYQERLVIQKYKPDIVLCGHIHENPGKSKVGRSTIHNPGSALNNRFMIMEI